MPARQCNSMSIGYLYESEYDRYDASLIWPTGNCNHHRGEIVNVLYVMITDNISRESAEYEEILDPLTD